jgi:antitoxin CptB
MQTTLTDAELLKKKIIYRSWYRGSKETDKILGFFVKKYIDDLSETELLQLLNLLDEQDVDIYDWVSGKKPIPADLQGNPVLKKIIDFSFSDEVAEMGIKLGN